MKLPRLLRTFSFGCVFAGLTASAQSHQDDFVKWTSQHAIRLSTVEAGDDFADLAPLRAVIGSAKVVALGEPTHEAHEPLAFRNRLIRFLVEQMGFTAVILETGFTESWSIREFTASGRGELADVVRNGFSWGFGAFGENRELVYRMRRYNSEPARVRKVRFYGIDLTGGDRGEFRTSRRAVDFAVALLARSDAADADKLRAALEPLLSKFSDERYNSLPAADRDRLEAGLSDLTAAITRNRTALIAGTSADEYGWALHSVEVAWQLSRMFRVAPPPSSDPGIPAGAGPAMTARDSGMAGNVRWALEQEGAGGKVIIFAHNAHVMNSKDR